MKCLPRLSPATHQGCRPFAAHADCLWVYPLVFLNDCFRIGRHHPGRFYPGLNFVLELL
jgi:hypothetical protein